MGLNVLLLLPVLLDAGAETQRPVCAALIASAAVALCAVWVLGSVRRAGSGAMNAEMPFLAVAGGNGFFTVAVSFAILTSLASALYPLLGICKVFRGKKQIAAKSAVLLAAFLLSRLGLSGVIGILYPVEGVIGLFVSAVWVLYEHFFEQNHEKVHPRGEHAEDTGRAHHKVELKDLPAVHDEIPEAGP